MKRRDFIVGATAVGAVCALDSPEAVGTKYIEIEISRNGGPFNAGEFDTLRAGDRFRKIWPRDPDGAIYTCATDAKPIAGQPGNFEVSVSRFDLPTRSFLGPPRPGDDSIDGV